MILLDISFENLHQVLRTLYDEMMPLCASMAGVAKGIAGLGALFYVAVRGWQSLAKAEPIDVYPLLRPFAIGFCIMFFPTFVLGTINSVMSPVVKGTNNILKDQTLNMERLSEQRDRLEYEAMKRDPEKAFLVDKEEFDKRLEELGVFDSFEILGMYMERMSYNFKRWLRNAIISILEICFQAASLVIDTIRTFSLVVLAILGPLAFAISVWDGFQSSLTQWLTRYISIYLWLPVSDLFGAIMSKINSLMIEKEIAKLDDPAFIPDGSSAVYIIFMLIGIVGFFTVPTVANWIVSSCTGNFGRNVNAAGAFVGGLAGSAAGNAAKTGGTYAAGAAASAAGYIGGQLKKLRNQTTN